MAYDFEEEEDEDEDEEDPCKWSLPFVYYIYTKKLVKNNQIFVWIVAVPEINKNNVHVVPREQWGALPPKLPIPNLERIPAPAIRFTHSRTRSCSGMKDCIALMKAIQWSDMNEKGLPDIASNFYVARDGVVYEGRGWDKQGVPTRPHKEYSLDFCLLGFETEMSTEQAEGFNALIRLSEAKKKLVKGLRGSLEFD